MADMNLWGGGGSQIGVGNISDREYHSRLGLRDGRLSHGRHEPYPGRGGGGGMGVGNTSDRRYNN